MLLYVAHKDESGSNSRYFSPERPTTQNLDLFGNFYFKIENTELKFYDVEKKEDYIECHIDVLHDGNWKTITTKNSKHKYSIKNLQKLTEDSHINFFKSKGISYILIAYAEIKNKLMIERYKEENKGNMTKYERELISRFI